MRTELAVALVAGLFGLIPLMVQIVSTRAQRRDRVYRLNQLQAELELLERLHALQGKVSATDEAAKPRTNLVINDALGKLLAQYNKLSKIAPSAAVGGKQPPARQLSFLRRAFLLYNPQTISGWVLHTLFYVWGFAFVGMTLMLPIIFADLRSIVSVFIVTVVIFGVPLLIIQRFARRNAARNAAQLEEPLA